MRSDLLVITAFFVFLSRATSSAIFTCDGGSTVLTADQVNDDYCDCTLDGTDETSTPACSSARNTLNRTFSCHGSGPLLQTVPVSRVWDGVCDCCDGSDELGNLGGGARSAVPCDPDGCGEVVARARAEAIETHRSEQIGLEKRGQSESEARIVVKRWEATMAQGEVDKKLRAEERKALEKLEVMLKVYLQDEERLETREREELAQGQRCSSSSAVEGSGSWAAAMGPCQDTAAEREAAAKVRAARAAARAKKDADEEKKKRARDDKKKRPKPGQGKTKKRKSAEGTTTSESGAADITTEDVLDLRWPTSPPAQAQPRETPGPPGKMGFEGEEGEGEGRSGKDSADAWAQQKEEKRGAKEPPPTAMTTATMSLRTYVKQRQQGSGGKRNGDGGAHGMTEERKAEELRKTALLGPVLNDGEKGAYLGLTYLLRIAGLPTLGVVRGLLTAVEFLRRQAAAVAAVVAGWLRFPEVVRAALEGYRDEGLPGVSRHLDYRRYPALRSFVVRWDDFLDGRGRFLLVMWDSPVALENFIFPERDYAHERPEAAMLREGLALTRAAVEARDVDDKRRWGGKGKGKGKGPHAEAERLYRLDLGEGRRFAALAEMCLYLEAGDYIYSLCPFQEAKQDNHSLGKWTGWDVEDGRDRHRSMLFGGGARCHNKRHRSAHVLVECGPEHSLVSADEVEVCSYRLTLETPLACSDENLLAAKRELDKFEVLAVDAGKNVVDAERGHGEL